MLSLRNKKIIFEISCIPPLTWSSDYYFLKLTNYPEFSFHNAIMRPKRFRWDGRQYRTAFAMHAHIFQILNIILLVVTYQQQCLQYGIEFESTRD